MSYFGRVGARAGGARQMGLAPAGPLSSPYARIDQRLNLLARLGAPIEPGRLLVPERGSAEASDQDGLDLGVAAPPPPARTAAAVEQAQNAAPRAASETALASAARQIDAPQVSRSAFEVAASAVERTREIRTEIAPAATERQPPPAPAPLPELARSTRDRTTAATGDPNRRAPQHDVRPPPVVPLERRAPAEGRPPAAADPAASALERALGQVERWMSQKPRRDPPADEPRPAPELSARAPSLAPAVGVREQAGLAGAAPPREAAPRLTIGSIDVRVIPPAPPPVVAVRHESPRRYAGRAGDGASAPRVPSHLTFGLRQR